MMLSPCLPQIMTTFRLDTSQEKWASFSVTIYMAGMAIGMFLFGPLSDVCGRRYIIRIAAIGFTVASVLCALSHNIGWLIATRAVAGIFGAAPMVIGGALVADLFAPGKRDTGMITYAIGPTVGPVIGSIIGSVVNDRLGWRWVFWLTSIWVSQVFFFSYSQSFSYLLQGEERKDKQDQATNL